EAMSRLRSEHPGTGLLVAADRFREGPFGPLEESRLDVASMHRSVALGGVSALKLYLFWRPEGRPKCHLDDARPFVDEAHALDVLALIEGVVTDTSAEGFDDALTRAAESMCSVRPDIYKTQLPTLGGGDDEAVERGARRVSEAAGGVPWVVLSNGV